jgi:hypothetical protein
MKHFLTILMICLSVNISAQRNISSICSNWFDRDGNWVLTLTNKVAIYKNKFWNYTIESNTDKKIILQMKDGRQMKKLSISVPDTSSIQISFNSENLILYKDQKVKIPIQNNAVSTIPEIVTINGYVKNFDQYREFNNLEFQFDDWLTGKYRGLFAKIDSSGGCTPTKWVTTQNKSLQII